MFRARRVAALAVSLVLASAGSAGAATSAAPLVDLAPQSTRFVDHVGPITLPAGSRAAGDSQPAAYKTKDGKTVRVQFSRSYTPNATIAQTYVDFLASLPHGSELDALRVYIATAAEVQAACGGQDGTLACYDPQSQTMAVPGEQTADDGSGVTTSYVVAHEYGHHIARHRSNAPFPSLSFGPKYWSSLELVCLRTLNHKLAPGNEGALYLENPGEAWADTYAHITYPDVAWQFTPLLVPTAQSKLTALRDVLKPWRGPQTRTFRGSLGPHVSSRTFSVTLHLDGSLHAALSGAEHARYDLRLSARGRSVGHTSGHGAQDRFSVEYGCRDTPAETIKVAVVRRSGHGPFKLVLSYPG